MAQEWHVPCWIVIARSEHCSREPFKTEWARLYFVIYWKISGNWFYSLCSEYGYDIVELNPLHCNGLFSPLNPWSIYKWIGIAVKWLQIMQLCFFYDGWKGMSVTGDENLPALLPIDSVYGVTASCRSCFSPSIRLGKHKTASCPVPYICSSATNPGRNSGLL